MTRKPIAIAMFPRMPKTVMARRSFLQGSAAAALGLLAAKVFGPSTLTSPLRSGSSSFVLGTASIVGHFAGEPDPDNEFVADEFGTLSFPFVPPSTNDTRQWDVFSCDLGLLYDGLDGSVYGFMGDTFGSDWSGPTAEFTPRKGNATLAPAMAGVSVASFTGSQSIALATAGSFTAGGGYAVVQLSSNGTLAYIRYGSRTSTTLLNCRRISGSGTMTAGDVVRGDDAWPGADWRSNVLFRSPSTDLSSGLEIADFRPLSGGTAPGIALQAIPGKHEGESPSNVFLPQRNITAAGVASSGGIVTVTTSAAHGLVKDQPVRVAGVVNAAYNGQFTVLAVVSKTKFQYALAIADGTSGSGTVVGSASIASIISSSWTVTVVTTVPHGLLPLQAVSIAGSGVADGEFLVRTKPDASTFTFIKIFNADGSGTVGTAQPATNVNAASPGANKEGSVIPSGAFAVDVGGGVKRHVAYYQDISYFGPTYFTNYMGIAYSDDGGNTWTRVGVTGASYQTVDVGKVWANNSSYTDHFQAAWPVLAGDGYVYLMCTMSGRSGDAYMARVPVASVLDKAAYRYWDGSGWNISSTTALPIFPDTAIANNSPVGEPCFMYHSGIGHYVACYLDPGAGGIVARIAVAPQGPWSSKQLVVGAADFGRADLYGGFLHPWSCTAPQGPNDLYFTVSLWRPYQTYLMKTSIALV